HPANPPGARPPIATYRAVGYIRKAMGRVGVPPSNSSFHRSRQMFEINETARMIQDMVRQWAEKNLRPNVHKLEKGEMLPFELMRDFANSLGIADMARMSLESKVKKLREKESGGSKEA